MVLIGFVLLAASAAFGIDLVAQNRFNIDIEAFGQVYTTTPSVVLVSGVVTGLVAALGLMMLRDGARRRRFLSHEAKQARATRTERAASNDIADAETIDVRDRTRDHVTTF
jgi:hypothetical protein